jgi:hypothetical protein
MKRIRPQTYKHTRPDGQVVRVTVPENDETELFEAIREQLSPHAVASIVSYLQSARTNNQDVDRQVRWFAEELVKFLGGYEQQARLAEELGL